MHLVHVTYRIFASNALGNKSPIFLMIMKPTPMLSSTSKTKLNKKNIQFSKRAVTHNITIIIAKKIIAILKIVQIRLSLLLFASSPRCPFFLACARGMQTRTNFAVSGFILETTQRRPSGPPSLVLERPFTKKRVITI